MVSIIIAAFLCIDFIKRRMAQVAERINSLLELFLVGTQAKNVNTCVMTVETKKEE